MHLGQMDRRVVLALLVPWVMWGLQVFKECREKEASLGLLGLRATEEQLVRKEQKAQLETTVQEEPQVLLAH